MAGPRGAPAEARAGPVPGGLSAEDLAALIGQAVAEGVARGVAQATAPLMEELRASQERMADRVSEAQEKMGAEVARAVGKVEDLVRRTQPGGAISNGNYRSDSHRHRSHVTPTPADAAAEGG